MEYRWKTAAGVAASSQTHPLPATYVLSPSEETPVCLTDSGEAIWCALTSDPRPESEIVSDVAQAYGIEDEVVAESISSFLETLEERGLVVRVG
ncbi:PqqD family protein [Falsarthrobacter nasiphocae]|uniref:PqqD family protein n=2 Tax=Falsarthrobacter nasiphocae TaxID=189863 RepID=A0AAE3YGX5_9MICC|nr:hypothetical protein [Falsarthrobacter nasiphocae]